MSPVIALLSRLLWSSDSRLDQWLRLIPWYRRRQTTARLTDLTRGW